MPSAFCRSWTATTPKLLDRGSGSAPVNSRTGLRISKSRTYPLGWRTPGGDEWRNHRRPNNQSLSMFMITTLVPNGLNVNTVIINNILCLWLNVKFVVCALMVPNLNRLKCQKFPLHTKEITLKLQIFKFRIIK